jgi:hypothetical protein
VTRRRVHEPFGWRPTLLLVVVVVVVVVVGHRLIAIC